MEWLFVFGVRFVFLKGGYGESVESVDLFLVWDSVVVWLW